MKELNIKGHIVVADALNCQKETADIIVKQEADYLLCVKDNHPDFKKDIEDYVQDMLLQATMQKTAKTEKGHGRTETRTAYVTTEIEWLEQREAWSGLSCIGAIHTEFTTKKGKSGEWHYYISSRILSPDELLHHARMEWAVESMHWLPDVHFDEDWCRVEDRVIQQNLNVLRKAAINIIKLFKERTRTKRAISKIMLDCLLNSKHISRLI